MRSTELSRGRSTKPDGHPPSDNPVYCRRHTHSSATLRTGRSRSSSTSPPSSSSSARRVDQSVGALVLLHRTHTRRSYFPESTLHAWTAAAPGDASVLSQLPPAHLLRRLLPDIHETVHPALTRRRRPPFRLGPSRQQSPLSSTVPLGPRASPAVSLPKLVQPICPARALRVPFGFPLPAPRPCAGRFTCSVRAPDSCSCSPDSRALDDPDSSDPRNRHPRARVLRASDACAHGPDASDPCSSAASASSWPR